MNTQNFLARRLSVPMAVASALTALAAPVAMANVWVFEPSASLDQRVDDNYSLDPNDPEQVMATRAIGSLSISREAPEHELRAFTRVDGLLSINEEDTNQLSSNQIFYLQNRLIRPRSEFDVKLSFKQDTPDRDISADITDLSQTAADTGASVTQDHDIDRRRTFFAPSLVYNLSRRLEVDLGYSYTDVKHGKTSCADALDRYLGKLKNDQEVPENPVFTVDPGDELDDFNEHAFSFSGRYRLSPLDTATLTLGFSRFSSMGDKQTQEFSELTVQDESCRNIRRFPKVETTSDAARISLGYQRQLTRTLLGEASVGYYQVESDDYLLQDDDDDTRLNEPVTTSGYLLNLSLQQDAGITQYKGSIAFDVYPSDIGSMVESLNVIGDVKREIGPLIDAHFRIRAYEPDALGDALKDDTFSRRFLSIEPRLIWRFSRAWTLAGSYRYRRQKSAGEEKSAQSNALLLSIKYTPPSAIADARKAEVDRE